MFNKEIFKEVMTQEGVNNPNLLNISDTKIYFRFGRVVEEYCSNEGQMFIASIKIEHYLPKARKFLAMKQ